MADERPWWRQLTATPEGAKKEPPWQPWIRAHPWRIGILGGLLIGLALIARRGLHAWPGALVDGVVVFVFLGLVVKFGTHQGKKRATNMSARRV
jgi:hypothetical protein